MATNRKLRNTASNSGTRRRIRASLILSCVGCLTSTALLADSILFRIGTGGSAGTYFPIGSLIAQAVSGTSQLHTTSNFSEPDLVAIAQRAAGSATNVADISNGLLEGALAQANVVHWAYYGSGPFEDEEPMDKLRGLATLYLESMHLVVRSDANINSIEQLKGKRVSLDESGSGTQLDTVVLLKAFGLTDTDIDRVYLKTNDAISRLRDNKLDAFFVIAGYPIKIVSELVAEGQAKVISISGPPVDKIIANYPFFSEDAIPAGTYQNAEALKTLGVPAQFILNQDLDEELVYNLTSMLWSEQTLSVLSEGHPKGHEVRLESALTGMNVPLHPGAKRFYREQGMLR